MQKESAGWSLLLPWQQEHFQMKGLRATLFLYVFYRRVNPTS